MTGAPFEYTCRLNDAVVLHIVLRMLRFVLSGDKFQKALCGLPPEALGTTHASPFAHLTIDQR